MGLDTVEIILWAEDKFGIEIPDADAAGIKTVGEFSEYIYRRLLIGGDFNAQSESVIFERIKAYLISHVEVKPELIFREAEFVRDLGLD
jgi:acyl carrier protein